MVAAAPTSRAPDEGGVEKERKSGSLEDETEAVWEAREGGMGSSIGLELVRMDDKAVISVAWRSLSGSVDSSVSKEAKPPNNNMRIRNSRN